MVPIDDVPLHLEKGVDQQRRTRMVLACIASGLGLAMAVLYVPLHPYLLALMAVFLALASLWVANRVTAMGPESVTITRGEVVVVKERERRYAIDPSTKVHLDTGKRGMTERIGPIIELTFENQDYGMARLAEANGWTQEQVAEVYRVIAPWVEPKEMRTSMRFRRYMRDKI
jgi:hypothetical protein